ncbi:TVP38/TMEM64 family protein [Epidermidibacterium keratini]|uniref:TVP38/TMEM64 family membrane protein n=1 Tax=Epidermidibacterium keratini TaxID=1891644 RepID=A0A7L4YQX2_9ACTN|nr:VTT domain-containing protein [Epidermidibacterium keratini]QHC01655.1 TVP38/TMEM64 family protein [Epidermidibacterium keratini]
MSVRGHLAGVVSRARELPASAWWKLAVFAGLFAAAAIVVLVAGIPSVAEARTYVRGLGAAAPVLFATGFGLLTLTPFPKSILAVVAGALWGLGLGLVICLAGVLLGATLAFFVGRFLIAHAVRGLAGDAMTVIDDAARKSTFLAVLAVRIIPVLPFTVMNFAFGVTVVRFLPFFAATGVGSILGTGAYVAVGAFGHDVTSWQFWAALAAVGSMTLVGLWVARRKMRKRKESS